MSVNEGKGPRYDFSSFLWQAMREIWGLEGMGNYVGALIRLLDLIKYLPVSVKEQIKPHAEQVKKQMQQLQLQRDRSHHYVRNLVFSRRRMGQAYQLFNELLDEVTTLLDKHNYLVEGRGEI